MPFETKAIPNKVSDLFYYDEKSISLLRHSTPRGGSIVGDVAGCIDNRGYWRVKVDGIPYRVSRVIWKLFVGDIPNGMVVDHINGNKTDDRLYNLRIVEQGMNTRNARMRKDNTSGVTGVSYNKRDDKWISFYSINGEFKTKTFAVKQFGHDKAKEMAIKFRKSSISSLIDAGAGSTERHGS